MTDDIMKRPETMSDQDWENFEYELQKRKTTLNEYEDYLTEIGFTLEQAWEAADHSPSYFGPAEQLAHAVTELRHLQWKRSIAVRLADEVLSRYLNTLQASIYAQEFAVRLVAFHDDAPNGILNDYQTIDQLADKALTWDHFQKATKAFMFDKLFGGGSE